MKGVCSMKKIFKFVISLASIAALAAGAYYFVKKVLLKDSYEDFDDFDDFDDDFDDFDDFDDDEDEEIVSVNMELVDDNSETESADN